MLSNQTSNYTGCTHATPSNHVIVVVQVFYFTGNCYIPAALTECWSFFLMSQVVHKCTCIFCCFHLQTVAAATIAVSDPTLATQTHKICACGCACWLGGVQQITQKGWNQKCFITLQGSLIVLITTEASDLDTCNSLDTKCLHIKGAPSHERPL